MKKLFFTLVILSLSTFAFSQIAGSAHDFSIYGWSGGRICIVCHTPHNADMTASDAPLWNHEVTAAVFTPYSSAWLNATVGQPTGVSQLCLSCHDGTVAVDSFGGAVGTVNIAAINVNADLGTDLSDTHPVGFTYDAALATTDGALFDPTTQATALGGTIQTDLLVNDQMECSSCHDVHNQYGFGNLLKISNGGSALCLTCHDK